MTIEEIKTSVTMALVKASTMEENKFSMKIEDDVVKHWDIVGEFLGKKFMFFCMREAQECFENQEKFDELFKKFDVVGARFTKYIDDAELDQIIADCDGEEN